MVKFSTAASFFLAMSAAFVGAAPANSNPASTITDPAVIACFKADRDFKSSVKETLDSLKALKKLPTAQDTSVQAKLKESAQSLFLARKVSKHATRAAKHGKSPAKAIQFVGKKFNEAQAKLSSLQLTGDAQAALQVLEGKLTQASGAEKAFETACGSVVTSGTPTGTNVGKTRRGLRTKA